jgi:hypothetical protein
LYFLNSPYGDNHVTNWTRFFPHTIVWDMGLFALFSLFFKLLNLPRITGFFLLFYMFIMGADDECARWINSRLYLSFLQVYINARTDFSIISKIFIDGLWHFCITISIVIATFIFYIFVKKRGSCKFSYITIIVFVVISIAGMTSKYWFALSQVRWRKITPIILVYAEEIFFDDDKEKSQISENGISILGGNPQAEYPFLQKQDDDSSYAAFQKMPLEEKPDIFILVIESLRGWKTDVRDSTVCTRIPNLCKFFSKATFFPEAHSVGFPSAVGHIGIQMGLWNHPGKALVMHYKILNAISLPEILGKAGYWRTAFTSSDPSFDNILSTLRDWFDYHEYYNPDNKQDVALADRFAEYLSKIDIDKPLYITWMSSASHVPFVVPNGKKGYDEALHYADSAIGIVLDAIENYRRNETIVIITGDHSYPEATNIKGIHSGYTHMPLFIQTPNTQNSSVMNKIVSQVDIAPTILDELNLSVSNSFPGHNLFSDSSYPIIAFRSWECAIYNYESQECEEAMKSWAWILDNNKLMPPP